MVNEEKPKISLMKLGLPTQLHPTPLNLSKIFFAKNLILTDQGFLTLALLTFGTQCLVPCTVGWLGASLISNKMPVTNSQLICDS